MWKRWLCVALLLVGCKKAQDEQAASTEKEPAKVEVIWRSISDDMRESTVMVLRSDREVEAGSKQRDGSSSNIKWKLPEEQYAKFIKELRRLDCCSLKSASPTRPSQSDLDSQLEIHLDGMECRVTLWNSEWRVGRARECGLAAAEVHGRGFLPDVPVGGPTPSADDAQQ